METLEKIIKKHKNVQVLLFDEERDISLVATFIKAGAKTFISKNTSTEELVNIIHKIHATKQREVSPEIYEAIMTHYFRQSKLGYPN